MGSKSEQEKMSEEKEIKRDYVRPSPEQLQKQLNEKMKKFLAKGGKIEKCEPMKPTKDQVKSWKI